jgi:hypothetical protein
LGVVLKAAPGVTLGLALGEAVALVAGEAAALVAGEAAALAAGEAAGLVAPAGLCSGAAIGPAEVGFFCANSVTVNCIACVIGIRATPLLLSIHP